MRIARNREKSSPGTWFWPMSHPPMGDEALWVLFGKYGSSCVFYSCRYALWVPKGHKDLREPPWNMKSRKCSTLLSFQGAPGQTEHHLCAHLAWVQALITFSPWTCREFQRSHAIFIAWNTQLLSHSCIFPSIRLQGYFMLLFCFLFFENLSLTKQAPRCFLTSLQSSDHSQVSNMPVGLLSFSPNTKWISWKQTLNLYFPLLCIRPWVCSQ